MISTARRTGLREVSISTEWLADMVSLCEQAFTEAEGARSEIVRLSGQVQSFTEGMANSEAMLSEALASRDAALDRLGIARAHLQAWAALTPRAIWRRDLKADLADLG